MAVPEGGQPAHGQQWPLCTPGSFGLGGTRPPSPDCWVRDKGELVEPTPRAEGGHLLGFGVEDPIPSLSCDGPGSTSLSTFETEWLFTEEAKRTAPREGDFGTKTCGRRHSGEPRCRGPQHAGRGAQRSLGVSPTPTPRTASPRTPSCLQKQAWSTPPRPFPERTATGVHTLERP